MELSVKSTASSVTHAQHKVTEALLDLSMNNGAEVPVTVSSGRLKLDIHNPSDF